jgi:hypothetical protein
MPRTTTRPAKAAKRAVAKKAAAPKGGAKKASPARKTVAPRRALAERKPQPAAAPAEARRTAAPPSADARSKYVYCVIESERPLRFGPLGLGAEPSDVHTVHFRDLAAVVSDTPREVIDATRENILAHERVNEAVMRSHTVIPMSFGTVFKTGDDIVELLRAAYEAFTDVLQKMQDKLEFGLKVLWDRDQIVREIEQADEMDAALEDYVERYVGAIVNELRPVSTASRSNKPIGEKMIMNAAFLVTREQENAFDAKVKEIGARYESLTFKYTGPWPPYNFVNIRLKLERAPGSE